MSDTKISDLSAASALGGTETLPGVQSAANVKITASQIKTFTSASPTLVTPALGTPASGTLTNCSGLPVSGITASTSTALGVGSIELGHASDTTLSRSAAGALAVEGIDVVTLSASQTLTNKTLTSPTLTTPTLGVATATSVNKVALTAPASGSTLTIADGKTLTASNSVTLTGTDSATYNLASMAIDAIDFVIDGGGSTITTGMKGYIEVPFACTINRATLLADQSGSIVVDIFKTTYSSFDAGGTHPVSGDKITASAPPTISSATKAQDSTLTGWTTSVSAGDILAFNVNSVATCQRVTLSLKVTKV